MADASVPPSVPTSELPHEEKTKRSGSFGAVASLYERYRPGPPISAVEWMLPPNARTVVDLGAGTGALTRLLTERVDHVIAVEPDARMREVLTEQVPQARAVEGRGDSMPLPDHCADAVLASSSWHWMDVVPTLHELARVLVPGGTLAAVWAGPDPDGPFMAQARAVIAQNDGERADGGLTSAITTESSRPFSGLEIPDGLPFAPAEIEVFRWDVALNADELIGLLGTFSWVILMEEDARTRLFETARRVLRDALGVSGDVTVDIGYRAEVFKARRHS
jgi:SAM-dependent methyltransferase